MRIRWRGLELPSRVACLRDKLTDSFGEFHVEPFERGFGHTVGNSLRRILLSSLEGSAVTTIKIQGVQHEFSSIPGMVEDITDLVLNLKLLVVKNHSDQSRTIRIERDRRGVVTGADIIHDESIEIINPDHILCTLTDDVPFNVDMTVENGRGYRTAAEGHTDDLEVGAHPDRRDVQPGPPGRVPGREHPRRPADELRQARDEDLDHRHAGPRDGPGGGGEDPPQAPQPVRAVPRARPRPPGRRRRGRAVRRLHVDAELERKLNMSLAELELSVRATNCLESEGITTVRDLVSKSEDQLLTVRNFGETTLKEVRAKLNEINLDLGMNVGTS